jgi:hypothetical protein
MLVRESFLAPPQQPLPHDSQLLTMDFGPKTFIHNLTSAKHTPYYIWFNDP